MNLRSFFSGRTFSKTINIILVAAVLILLFVPNAKSWLLQQLVTNGLFKAHIEKDTATANLPEAPFFSFKDGEGNKVDTKDLKGKVLFINFWASWCPPCRAEMPSLNALYNKFKTEDRLVFIFINEDEDIVKQAAYLQHQKWSIPLHTVSSNIPDVLFSGSLPTTVVIDKNGKIVLKHEGMADYHSDKFISQLKSLL